MEAGLCIISMFNLQTLIFLHACPLHFIAKVKVIKVGLKLSVQHHCVSFYNLFVCKSNDFLRYDQVKY